MNTQEPLLSKEEEEEHDDEEKMEEEGESIVWILDAAHQSMLNSSHQDRDFDKMTRFEYMKQTVCKVIHDYSVLNTKKNVEMSVIVLLDNKKRQLSSLTRQVSCGIIDGNHYVGKSSGGSPYASTLPSSLVEQSQLCKIIEALRMIDDEDKNDRTQNRCHFVDMWTALLLATEILDGSYNTVSRFINNYRNEQRILLLSSSSSLNSDSDKNSACRSQPGHDFHRTRLRRRKRIVLFTDGEHKLNDSIQACPIHLVQTLKRLHDQRVSLHVIGFDFQNDYPSNNDPSNKKNDIDRKAPSIVDVDDSDNFEIENNEDSEKEENGFDNEDSDDDSQSSGYSSSSSCDFVDDDKLKNEAFLIGLVKKTSGFVMSAPSDMEVVRSQLLTEESHICTTRCKRPLEHDDDLNAKKYRLVASTATARNEENESVVQILSPKHHPKPPMPASAIVASASIPASDSNNDDDSDDDDDVEIVKTNVTNANVDLPHKRVHCGVFPFKDPTKSGGDGKNNNKSYCPNCYCVVCDKPAKDCNSWKEHCQENREKKVIPSVEPVEPPPWAQGHSGNTNSDDFLTQLIMANPGLLQRFLGANEEGDDDDRNTTSRVRRQTVRYYWDETYCGMSFDDWLSQMRPSQHSKSDCAWIQATNTDQSSPGYRFPDECRKLGLFEAKPFMSALHKLSRIIQSGHQATVAEKEACIKCLLRTAKSQQCTVGNWIVFIPVDPLDAADELWEKVARATVGGTLGYSSKVDPIKGMRVVDHGIGTVECCISVKDCTDRSEVKRVLLALQQDLGLTVECGFRPEFYTELGIDRNNQWQLSPFLYPVSEVSEWEV